MTFVKLHGKQSSWLQAEESIAGETSNQIQTVFPAIEGKHGVVIFHLGIKALAYRSRNIRRIADDEVVAITAIEHKLSQQVAMKKLHPIAQPKLIDIALRQPQSCRVDIKRYNVSCGILACNGTGDAAGTGAKIDDFDIRQFGLKRFLKTTGTADNMRRHGRKLQRLQRLADKHLGFRTRNKNPRLNPYRQMTERSIPTYKLKGLPCPTPAHPFTHLGALFDTQGFGVIEVQIDA